jgi:hypothetical protein
MRSEIGPMNLTVRELMRIAESEADPALLSEAHLLAGIGSNFSHAEGVQMSIDHADKAVAHFNATVSGFVEFRVGPNPGVVANAVAGLFRWTAGLADSAVARMDEAIRLAFDLDHPYSMAYALHHAAVLHLSRLDFHRVAALAEQSLHLATAHDYPVWGALAVVFRGAARAACGAPDGLADIEEGFARYRELSTPPVFWPGLLLVRAGAYAMAGEAERALVLLDEVEANLQAEDPLTAEVAITRGEVLLALSTVDDDAAEALFDEAAAIAEAREARMVQLVALTRLADVRRERDSYEATRQRLRECCEAFTEGFDTMQLTAARAHLQEGALG